MQIDVNKPAFPVPTSAVHTGVTLREWYAAMALQGLVAKGLDVCGDRTRTPEERDMELALGAFRLADAMVGLQSKSDSAPTPAAMPASEDALA